MGWRNEQAERNHGVKNIGLKEPLSERDQTIAAWMIVCGMGLLFVGSVAVMFLVPLAAALSILSVLVGSG